MTVPTPPPNSPGGMIRRFGFRFVAAYLVIYNSSTLIDLLPYTGRLGHLMYVGWNQVVPWTERVVMGMSIPAPNKPNGSGDTSFLWARNGCILSAAFAVGLAWSFFDRRRRWEPFVSEFLRVFVRYALGATLVGYGVAKLLPMGQFPAPSGSRLLEPVGRLSPMGMLWVFMGASKAYSAFSGAMEISGGVLLFWRRTAPLGALVSAGVLLNIVLLNFCYDVPVKLFSVNLLLMAVFLLWPDLRRLADVLVLNQPTSAASLAPPWRSGWYRVSSAVLKVVVLGSLLFEYGQRLRSSGPDYKPAPASLARLSGFWNVESFRSDGLEKPALLTDGDRWRRVIFDEPSGGLRMIALGANNQWLVFGMVGPESNERTLQLISDSKDKPPISFALAHLAPDRITISGDFKGRPIVVTLGPADKDDLRLLNRGFHWVNEVPFNR
jgi:hypothetical protein